MNLEVRVEIGKILEVRAGEGELYSRRAGIGVASVFPSLI
jgi:hypothetical protein